MRRQYEGEGGRAAFVARFLEEHPCCGAGLEGCTGRSVDVHERLARSAGGNILPVERPDGTCDESNFVAVCRACHRRIGDRPREALALGLRRSRYPGRNPEPSTGVA